MTDTIVITGAGGFIGYNLVEYLLKFTRCDLQLIEAETCHPQSLRRLRRHINAGRVRLDFVDTNKLDAAVKTATTRYSGRKYIGLVHLGATCSTRAVESAALWRNNIDFSTAIIERYAEYCPVLFASTAAIYNGNSSGTQEFHEYQQIDPHKLSAYAWTKYAVEQAVSKMPLRNDVIALRFFNVYGEHEEHKGDMISFPGRVWRELQETGETTVYDSRFLFLTQTNARDFVHVEDCCSLMLTLLKLPEPRARIMPLNGKQFAVLNVGTGTAVPLTKAAQLVADEYSKRTNSAAKVIEECMPSYWKSTYQPYTCADTDLLNRVKIKFRSFQEGMESFRWVGSPVMATESK